MRSPLRGVPCPDLLLYYRTVDRRHQLQQEGEGEEEEEREGQGELNISEADIELMESFISMCAACNPQNMFVVQTVINIASQLVRSKRVRTSRMHACLKDLFRAT